MMRSIIGRFILIVAIFMLLTPGISLSKQEQRIALVIGNSSYKSSPLANPVNDANDMADALTKCNFRVIKTINANRREMRRAIREFGHEIKSGVVGLFYYAGHGIQVKGENYLVPIGSEVYSEDEVEDECLKVSSVLRKMETAGNRLNIIILDACRDNPFGRSLRSRNRGLAKMDAPTGSILAYATAPGSVAKDGPGRNGLYTSKLLKHMMAAGLEIGKLFRQVRIDVMDASGKRQVPWESSSLTGDFHFIPKRAIALVKPPTLKERQKIIDEERRKIIREKEVRFTDYLKKMEYYLHEFKPEKAKQFFAKAKYIHPGEAQEAWSSLNKEQNAKCRINLQVTPDDRNTVIEINGQSVDANEIEILYQDRIEVCVNNKETIWDPVEYINKKRWNQVRKAIELKAWHSYQVKVKLDEWKPGRIEKISVPVYTKWIMKEPAKDYWFVKRDPVYENVVDRDRIKKILVGEYAYTWSQAQEITRSISKYDKSIWLEVKEKGKWEKGYFRIYLDSPKSERT